MPTMDYDNEGCRDKRPPAVPKSIAQQFQNKCVTLQTRRLLYEHIAVQAQSLENDAAMGGAHNDGGAMALKNKWAIVNDILEGRVPEFLREIIQQIDRESDPDWQEYQRLQAKFSPDKTHRSKNPNQFGIGVRP